MRPCQLLFEIGVYPKDNAFAAVTKDAKVTLLGETVDIEYDEGGVYLRAEDVLAMADLIRSRGGSPAPAHPPVYVPYPVPAPTPTPPQWRDYTVTCGQWFPFGTWPFHRGRSWPLEASDFDC